jgi:DNA-binding XRE family transcriptional regulator
MKFEKAFKSFRKEKKLTLDEFARTMNVSRGTIVNWENGGSSPPIHLCLNFLVPMGFDFTPFLRTKEDLENEDDLITRVTPQITKIIKYELRKYSITQRVGANVELQAVFDQLKPILENYESATQRVGD